MRRFLACLLAMTMFISVFSCLTFSASAANEAESFFTVVKSSMRNVTTANVYSVEQNVNAGETVKVPVYISNNPGILGLKLSFDYDSSVLTPINVEYGEAMNYGIEDNIEGDATVGKINVYWAGSDNSTAEGIWFYINFAVNLKSKGETKISISYSQADTFNEDFEDVVLNCSPVTINITNSAYSDAAAFSLWGTSCRAGENFSVSIKADVLTDIDSAVFEFTYNKDLFTYQSSDAAGVRAAVTETDNGIRVNATNLTTSLQGKDILTLNFASSENTIGGKYEFSSRATVSGKEVLCSSCSVHINSGTMSGAVISTENVFALPGDTIEIPINIKNNPGIMGFKLFFGFDDSVLTPVSVNKGAILSEGTLNDSIGVGSSNSISVLWNNTSEVIGDGSILLLRFKVNENADYESLKIKVTYSENDTFNESYDDVALICNDVNLAITNLIPVDKNETTINPSEGYIYTSIHICTDIEKIVSASDGTMVSATASYYNNLGTGSKVVVKDSNGIVLENYTLIVPGDFDGDSATDVIDAALLILAINNDENIDDAATEAVDFDDNGYVDIADYQSTVNYILSN